jgi:hypothetical protein
MRKATTGKEAPMNAVWLTIVQLTFVTVLYCCAYRLGYRDAQARIKTLIREINRPLKDLFERTRMEMDKLQEEEESEEPVP